MVTECDTDLEMGLQPIRPYVTILRDRDREARRQQLVVF